MKASFIVEENEDYVVYGELQDEFGYSPDAELFRGTKTEAEAFVKRAQQVLE
jgi:hypothetical protein